MKNILSAILKWLESNRNIEEPTTTGILLDGVFIKDTDAEYPCALAVLAARRVHNND